MKALAMIEVGVGNTAEQTAMAVEAAAASDESRQMTVRSNAVIILERDGSLVRGGLKDHPPNPARGYAELPVQMIEQQSSLIDRLLAFAFDTLGLTSLVLRVYEQD